MKNNNHDFENSECSQIIWFWAWSENLWFGSRASLDTFASIFRIHLLCFSYVFDCLNFVYSLPIVWLTLWFAIQKYFINVWKPCQNNRKGLSKVYKSCFWGWDWSKITWFGTCSKNLLFWTQAPLETYVLILSCVFCICSINFNTFFYYT